VWFFQFLKNPVGSGSLKTTESKNCQFRLFQKPYRTSGFDERADSFLAGSLTFSYVFRTMVIYQNGFFEYFENWRVHGYNTQVDNQRVSVPHSKNPTEHRYSP
jgi:hypothetical protein